MGEGASKPVQQIDFSSSHPRFSNAKFLISGKDRLMQTTMAVDDKQYERWKNSRPKGPENHSYLLLPLKDEFSGKGLCGSSGVLTLDFPNYPYLLSEELEARRGRKKLFEERELWYLLFALTSAKKDTEPAYSKVGDVRPHNIFINQAGDVKVTSLNSWPGETTNFRKAFEGERTYLAPEEIVQLQKGGVESQKNEQSELFSIGLTLLSLATLTDFLETYDVKKYHLDLGFIQEKLNYFTLNKIYSDIFKGVVCNLCQFDPAQRVDSRELWQWISPHQKPILSRENFFIPSAPEKIHHQVGLIRQIASQLLGIQQEFASLIQPHKPNPQIVPMSRPIEAPQTQANVQGTQNIVGSGESAQKSVGGHVQGSGNKTSQESPAQHENKP